MTLFILLHIHISKVVFFDTGGQEFDSTNLLYHVCNFSVFAVLTKEKDTRIGFVFFASSISVASVPFTFVMLFSSLGTLFYVFLFLADTTHTTVTFYLAILLTLQFLLHKDIISFIRRLHKFHQAFA